ncbi:hypothetical protein ZIOFF_053680 [Zingiber officinale]|uniref:Retrovirus-related Pol polyprotein from transposon TNT 1-94-like beta-barrel domain-containing protein n=1 Tax=Zingiber officinale TaxID=94328 RepID=A0A8J5KM17_ZINOF|nr:hypothetical protein ZIOFF_053680 [Zingiber officinale]
MGNSIIIIGRLSTHLKIQNLWSSIDPGLSEGDDVNSQRRDQLALGQIHQGVDYSIFGMIANAKTTKEAWDILKLSYKRVDRAQKSKLQSLRRNDVVVEKILRTIPLKYDHVVTSIQETHDIEQLTIAELKEEEDSIEVVEEDIKEKDEVITQIKEEVEIMSSKISFRLIAIIVENIGTKLQIVNTRNSTIVTTRQILLEIMVRILMNMKLGNQANIVGNYGENTNEYETLVLASNSFPVDENVWFLNPGCSNHMCGRKELFSELDESIQLEVTFGNKTKVPIFRKDCDPISFEDAAKKGLLIKACLYVDDPIFTENNLKLITKFREALKYASDILKRFRMECLKLIPTPMIEKIKLSKDETVGVLSGFMEKPKKSHWAAVKRILR